MKKHVFYLILSVATLAATPLFATNVLNEDCQKRIIAYVVAEEKPMSFEVTNEDSYQRSLTIKCNSPIPLVNHLWRNTYYTYYQTHLSLDGPFLNNCKYFNPGVPITTDFLQNLTNEDGTYKSGNEVAQFLTNLIPPCAPYAVKLNPLIERHLNSVRSLKILNAAFVLNEDFAKKSNQSEEPLPIILSYHFPFLSSLTLYEGTIDSECVLNKLNNQCPHLVQLCVLENPSIGMDLISPENSQSKIFNSLENNEH